MLKHKVKRICMCCKADLGLACWESDRPDVVTHSLCPPNSECYRNYVAVQMAELEGMDDENNILA